MQKITPFLWFDDKAEEAVNFYVSVLRILRSEALSAMEKKLRRSLEDQKER